MPGTYVVRVTAYRIEEGEPDVLDAKTVPEHVVVNIAENSDAVANITVIEQRDQE